MSINAIGSSHLGGAQTVAEPTPTKSARRVPIDPPGRHAKELAGDPPASKAEPPKSASVFAEANSMTKKQTPPPMSDDSASSSSSKSAKPARTGLLADFKLTDTREGKPIVLEPGKDSKPKVRFAVQDEATGTQGKISGNVKKLPYEERASTIERRALSAKKSEARSESKGVDGDSKTSKSDDGGDWEFALPPKKKSIFSRLFGRK